MASAVAEERPEDRSPESDETQATSVTAVDFLSFARKMWVYIRPDWKIGFVLIVGLCIESGFEAFMRPSSKILIDDAIIPQDRTLLLTVLSALGLGAVVASASTLTCDYLWARFAARVMNRIREELFVHLQRLSMDFYARSQVRKPQLLLLDEATSALDPATEASINETLDRISKGRTMISVTHRLASVVNVNQLFLFDQGRLVEQGIHDELVRRGGHYARLWEKQNGFAKDSQGRDFKVDLAWLKALPFFKGVDPSILEDVAGMFINERFAENRVVIYEGDPGDKFFIIVRGRVLAGKKEHPSPTDKTVLLNDGDYFGEIALLKNVPRTSSVVTLPPCIFLSLRQDQFMDLMKRAPDLRSAMEKSYLGAAIEATPEVLARA